MNPPDEFNNYDKVRSDQLPPNRFIVAALYHDADGNQKTNEILEVIAEPFGWDLLRYLKDKSLEGEMQRGLAFKSVNPRSVFSISIRLGKNGERVYFDRGNDKLA